MERREETSQAYRITVFIILVTIDVTKLQFVIDSQNITELGRSFQQDHLCQIDQSLIQSYLLTAQHTCDLVAICNLGRYEVIDS